MGLYAVCAPLIDREGRLVRWEPISGGAGLTLSAARTHRNLLALTTNDSLVICKSYRQGEDLGTAWWTPMRAGMEF